MIDNRLFCHWCGVSLANASQVTYLGGNLPVCELCLIKAQSVNVDIVRMYWCRCGGSLHQTYMYF